MIQWLSALVLTIVFWEAVVFQRRTKMIYFHRSNHRFLPIKQWTRKRVTEEAVVVLERRWAEATRNKQWVGWMETCLTQIRIAHFTCNQIKEEEEAIQPSLRSLKMRYLRTQLWNLFRASRKKINVSCATRRSKATGSNVTSVTSGTTWSVSAWPLKPNLLKTNNTSVLTAFSETKQTIWRWAGDTLNSAVTFLSESIKFL